VNRPCAGHAVVLGGSIAGLLAARVAADFFEQVTIVERDGIGEGGGEYGSDHDGAPLVSAHRRGVPHGRHLHALMDHGRQIMDGLFPSLTAELSDRGAPTADPLVGGRLYFNGRRVRPTPTGLTSLLASRPLLENAVRARTLALPNIQLRSHLRAVGFVAASSSPASRGAPGRVIGVRVVGRGHRAEPENAEIINADLAIDATGRGSRAPEWLAALGLPRPREERIDLDLGYASRTYRRTPGDLAGDHTVIVTSLPKLRSGGAIAQEADRWIVTLAGLLGDHPPTDPTGFAEFAACLPAPDIHRLITDAEPLDDAVPYHFRGSLRRRYDRLNPPCDGFISIGDAACSLNPIYAQGMTVAAQQALVLAGCLRSGGTEALPKRYFAAAATPVGHAWTIAADSDLRCPGVSAPRPLRTRVANAYLPRLQAATHRDPTVARLFVRVANLIDPPSALMKPGIVLRVARHGR
jgi:2-polyprenyl-6-methoxyphenol hydroxylase-like FAD-dependent oxidoreductase